MRWRGAAVLLLALPGAAAAQDVAGAARTITPDDIRRRIGIIADDSMRGRDTPSPELEQVAAYLAAEFRRFGLRPAGDPGSFLQRYGVRWTKPDSARTALVITAAGGATALKLGRDLILLPSLPAPTTDLAGPVVLLAGPPDSANPLAGLDVKGAWLVLPGTATNGAGLGLTLDERAASGALLAGAAGVIVVSNRPDARWQGLAAAGLRPVVSLEAPGGEGVNVGVLELRDAAAARVLGLDPAALRASPTRVARRLAGVTISFRPRARVLRRITAPNVVGILEGSDPRLKHEYVVFSAHMDHVGVGQPLGGDSIFNGADDDASGTIAVVEAAQAFARLTPRPRRSIIFLTVSGEEKGLWGSSYFTTHFPVPGADIVADLNIDMVGRNWKDTIVVIGKEHSDLGPTLDRVAAAHPELDMRPIDDLWPQENFYRRSDHFNFARKGIPILFFFNGTHADYHGRGDTVDKIDAEKESRIVRLAFYLGLEIANRGERPRWNPESYRLVVDGAR